MKKIVVVVPHSHTWFWTSTCISCLHRNPPRATGYDVSILVIDNSAWSPAIRCITDTDLGLGPERVVIMPNFKSNPFHASALDCVVDDYDFDLLMTLETDVLVAKPNWLQWFVDQLKPNDYAVGAWHHEQFVNPSCTLYRGDVLRSMNEWCKNYPDPENLHWGTSFSQKQPISLRQPERDYRDWYDSSISWIAGPFAEKRGWPEGTVLKDPPSGQMKGPGWYEPGQQLHAWAVDKGYTYTICPNLTTTRADNLPLQTLYGSTMPDPQRQLEAEELFGNAYAAHMWGGTRALDIVKHQVTCQFVKSNTPMWLAREARFWRQVVPADIQTQILELIRKWGWHYTGQSNTVKGGDQRDREAVELLIDCYQSGSVSW